MSIAYLYLYLQSTLLELPVYLYFLKSSKRNIFFSIMAINAITHPIFFYVIMGLQTSFLINVLIGEAFLILLEAYLIHKKFNVHFKETLYLSIHANILSWQLSPILSYFLAKAI